jgi:adenosylcobinamide hydrolase
MTGPAPRPLRLAGMPALLWRPDRPWLAISSAPHGGGLGLRHWVFNRTVESGYDHPDPAAHLAELAAGFAGPGVGLLTAVDVGQVRHAEDGGVSVHTTTGVTHPVWAAAPPEPAPAVGTINVVAWLPARLADAALVNAVATVAEAKAQALAERGVPGTGTPTDATVVLCPSTGPAAPYGGPRSEHGSSLARAVRESVLAGLDFRETGGNQNSPG